VSANGQQDDNDASPLPISPPQKLPSPVQITVSPVVIREDTSPFLEPSLQPLTANVISMTPSRYPITADSFHPRYSPVTAYDDPRLLGSMANGNSLGSRNGDSQSYHSPIEPFNDYPPYNWSYKQPQTSHPPSKIWPSLSMYYRPHRLEEIAPRETISLIIALFFDFV
jgi:hypothetical protein